jgi:hypothetical protein
MQLITREELKATLDASDDSRLVMVVGPWEFRARHIPGSLGFPSHGRGWPRRTATTTSSSTPTTTIA